MTIPTQTLNLSEPYDDQPEIRIQGLICAPGIWSTWGRNARGYCPWKNFGECL